MAFVSYTPEKGRLACGLVTIGVRGFCSFNADDLAAIRASESVRVFIDDSGPFIALAAPSRGDYRLAVHYKDNASGVSGRIFLRRVFERLGLRLRDYAGRRPLEIKEGKIVIDLSRKNGGVE